MKKKSSVAAGVLRRLGPGLITACVVIGPGSLLTSTKVGATHGYQLGWVLLVAVGLMMVFMSMGARLGVMADGTPGEILASRIGRWLPALIGISVFCIAACYQFGNNIGAASALGAFLSEEWAWRKLAMIAMVSVLNLLALLFLFAFADLYRALERLMVAFVALMLISFFVNLWAAGVDFTALAQGLVPNIPRHESSWLDLIGWVGTTFITAIAYYQAYLVRQKGWTPKEMSSGLTDARFGALVLASLTLMIMMTAAAVLPGQSPSSVSDVATQLEPMFGTAGKAIFCVGLFSAAYSSFLINSMIGGFLLTDGFGFGSDPKTLAPRLATAAVLLSGWGIGVLTLLRDVKPVAAVVLAQALTVLAAPLIGGALWWLTSQRSVVGEARNGWLTHLFAGLGLLTLLIFSGYLILKLVETLI